MFIKYCDSVISYICCYFLERRTCDLLTDSVSLASSSPHSIDCLFIIVFFHVVLISYFDSPVSDSVYLDDL